MRPRFCLNVVLGIVLLFFGSARVSAQGIGSLLTFPHIAHGAQANGAWRTTFTFVNNSPTTVHGFLRMFGDGGEDLILGTNQGTDNLFNITIPPRGGLEIESDGIGPLATGWAFAAFDHAVVGSAVFSFNTAQETAVSVGVLDAPPFTAYLTPAEARTGIALTNPFNASQTLQMQALDLNGNQAASRSLTLAPGNHVAMVVQDLFTGLTFDFVGSVRIQSDLRFSALAIGFVPTASFFAVPAIGYDALATSYSGTFSSDAGVGALTATGLEHLTSNMFTGDITSNNQSLGLTLSGPFVGNADDRGVFYSFLFLLEGLNEGFAIATLEPDGSFIGTIADDGAGNAGTFVLSPQAGSTGTVVSQLSRSVARPPAMLKRWGDPALPRSYPK